jgi:hypothetical protein
MSAHPQSKAEDEADQLEAAADQAIAACGGDMRSAIGALILANEFLEHEVKELMVAVSKGYSRSKRHDAPNPLPRDRKDWYD